MDIAIIGAGGGVGREIARQIVSDRLLERDQRLLLVGNSLGRSAKTLYGLRMDLIDAFAEITPRIEVILEPEAIQADLIVMTAGETLKWQSRKAPSERSRLSETNSALFHHYARSLSKNGRGHEIVLCVSNPNELCVAVFSKYLGRNRVIGMGAFLDSLRFRMEIARNLNIRRQRIHGFMIGEHGENIVPLWSSIHIFGFNDQPLQEALQKIRGRHRTLDFPEEVASIRGQVMDHIQGCRIQEAYALIDQYPPDFRVALKPFVTHFSGSRTLLGTARATMDLIQTIMLGSDALISGQITLDGEFHGIKSTIGAPFVIGNNGVDRIIELRLADDELLLFNESARQVNEKILPFLN